MQWKGSSMQHVLHGAFLASLVLASWLGMQAIHEAGHVLGALAVGARVENVVLHPLTISRTDVAPHEQQLVVIWAGPLLGMALPLMLFAVAYFARCPGVEVLRFFAGFCLIANGAYIGLGSFARIGDCDELLRAGAPLWQLWLVGTVGIPAGLWLWNGLGKRLGVGRNAALPDRPVILATFAVMALLLVLGLYVDH